jgi:hypothetical protein
MHFYNCKIDSFQGRRGPPEGEERDLFMTSGMMPNTLVDLKEEQTPSPFAGMEPRPRSHWDHETRMKKVMVEQQEAQDRDHGLVRGTQKKL